MTLKYRIYSHKFIKLQEQIYINNFKIEVKYVRICMYDIYDSV